MANFKHGGARLHIKLYRIWQGMNNRCYRTKTTSYPLYGGRGITVCDEWRRDPVTFIKWAVCNGYGPGLSIDRKDSNGNYQPDNCRWSTAKCQARNRRNNRLVTHNGITKCVGEWASEYGLHDAVVHVRIFRYGWSVEEALNRPLTFRRRKRA